MRQNTKVLLGEVMAAAFHQLWDWVGLLNPYSFFAASRLRVRREDK